MSRKSTKTNSTLPTQRIYISDRRDSTRHRLTKMWLTQPLHALSAVFSNYLTVWQNRRERLGESLLSKIMAGAVPSITNIYSLSILVPLTLAKKIREIRHVSAEFSTNSRELRCQFAIPLKAPLDANNTLKGRWKEFLNIQ